MTAEQVEHYYAGFSNSALWPLCHQAHVRPQFRDEDWRAYQDVNRLFADSVALEAPLGWITPQAMRSPALPAGSLL